MIKFIILFFIIALGTGCATHKAATTNTKSDSGEIGSSFKTAIVIKEKTETTGVSAKALWRNNSTIVTCSFAR